MILGEDDYLIDSEGNSYSLQSSSNQLNLAKRPEQYSIWKRDQTDSQSWVPKSRSVLLKIHFPTIEEAIQSLSFEAVNIDSQNQSFKSPQTKNSANSGAVFRYCLGYIKKLS